MHGELHSRKHFSQMTVDLFMDFYEFFSLHICQFDYISVRCLCVFVFLVL